MSKATQSYIGRLTDVLCSGTNDGSTYDGTVCAIKLKWSRPKWKREVNELREAGKLLSLLDACGIAFKWGSVRVERFKR